MAFAPSPAATLATQRALAMRWARYGASCLRGDPLGGRIRRLPPRRSPALWWVRLSDLEFTGYVTGVAPPGARVLPGDWDREHVHERVPIREPAPADLPRRDKHETVRLLFVEGHDHPETPEYAAMRRSVEAGQPVKGRRTVAEVEDYFDELRALHRSMATEGYRTAAERGRAEVDEARLFVTRDGRLCHGMHGRHRIAIADLLGIRWAPMVLFGVHPGWVEQLCGPRTRLPHRALTSWLDQHDGLRRDHGRAG
jgi:hypothetical protein